MPCLALARSRTDANSCCHRKKSVFHRRPSCWRAIHHCQRCDPTRSPPVDRWYHLRSVRCQRKSSYLRSSPSTGTNRHSPPDSRTSRPAPDFQACSRARHGTRRWCEFASAGRDRSATGQAMRMDLQFASCSTQSCAAGYCWHRPRSVSASKYCWT